MPNGGLQLPARNYPWSAAGTIVRLVSSMTPMEFNRLWSISEIWSVDLHDLGVITAIAQLSVLEFAQPFQLRSLPCLCISCLSFVSNLHEKNGNQRWRRHRIVSLPTFTQNALNIECIQQRRSPKAWHSPSQRGSSTLSFATAFANTARNARWSYTLGYRGTRRRC